jgi:thiosulfate/3-mercaptopyruvate sulfurtransferase
MGTARSFLLLAVVIVLLCLLCGAFDTPPSARPRLLIETDWLAAHSADNNLIILHVGRDRSTYDSGHIPNARFLAFDKITVTRSGIPNQLPSAAQLKAAFEKVGVSDKVQVVLYGDHSGLYAARAYFTLDYLGHGSQAALLNGGLEKWKSESRPLSKEQPTSTPASLTLRPNPKLVVDRRRVKQMLKDPRVILIDARPPDEYSGAKLSDGALRPGHIPGAVNVFWLDNLESAQNPVFKPFSSIQNNYEQAGVGRGKRVVVYCRTGVQASHDYLTLKMLGYKPALYDASFLEWSNTKHLPVAAFHSPRRQP